MPSLRTLSFSSLFISIFIYKKHDLVPNPRDIIMKHIPDPREFIRTLGDRADHRYIDGKKSDAPSLEGGTRPI